MSEVKDDGGPAFPQDLQGRRGDDPQLQGMTLRDAFAISIKAPSDYAPKFAEKVIGKPMPEWHIDPIGTIAFWAEFNATVRYMEADAMIKARKQS